MTLYFAVLLLALADQEGAWASALCLRSGLRKDFLRVSLESGALRHALRVVGADGDGPVGSTHSERERTFSKAILDARSRLEASQAAHYIAAFFECRELSHLACGEGEEVSLPRKSVFAAALCERLRQDLQSPTALTELGLSFAFHRGVEACTRAAVACLSDPDAGGDPAVRDDCIQALETAIGEARDSLQHKSNHLAVLWASKILDAVAHTTIGQKLLAHAVCSETWHERSRETAAAMPQPWYKEMIQRIASMELCAMLGQLMLSLCKEVASQYLVSEDGSVTLDMRILIMQPICTMWRLSAGFGRVVADAGIFDIVTCADQPQVSANRALPLLAAMLAKYASAERISLNDGHMKALFSDMHRADDGTWIAAVHAYAFRGPSPEILKESARILRNCNLEGDWPWDMPSVGESAEADIICAGVRTLGYHVWEYARLEGLCMCVAGDGPHVDQLVLGWIECALSATTEQG